MRFTLSGGGRLQAAVESLNLTDDQKAKDIFADAKAKRQTVFSDTSLSDDQKKAKMKELHADTLAKVNNMLTPDQQTELKQDGSRKGETRTAAMPVGSNKWRSTSPSFSAKFSRPMISTLWLNWKRRYWPSSNAMRSPPLRSSGPSLARIWQSL